MAVSNLVAAGGGVTPKVQEFTGNGTFTAPSNCQYVEVFLVGGGGGGGSAQAYGSGGGGGGGEVIDYRKISVTPGTAYTVTIGGGGTGSSSNAAGGDGTNSTFGSLLTAGGGGGGGTVKTGPDNTWPNVKATSGGTPYAAAGVAGGGGGAANILPHIAPYAPTSTANSVVAPMNNQLYSAITGTLNGMLTTGNNSVQGSVAGPGIQGYGGGGQPGNTNLGGAAKFWNAVSVAGGGVGGLAGTANSPGGNGVANKGGGGGGAAYYSSATNGGNGGSGYCLVVYWS